MIQYNSCNDENSPLLDIQARRETLRAEAELLVSSNYWSGEAALWTLREKELENLGWWQQLWGCSCLSSSASTFAHHAAKH